MASYEGLNLDPELYSVCKARVPRVRWEEETQEGPDTCKGPDPVYAAAKKRELSPTR